MSEDSERRAEAPSRPTEELTRRHARLLRAEQVRLLYGSSSIALVTTPMASITRAVVSWGHAPRALTVAWCAYVLGVAALRAMMVRRYQRLPPEAVDVPVWCRRFVVGVAAAGLGWGAAALLFISETSVPRQMLLALILAGAATPARGVPPSCTARRTAWAAGIGGSTPPRTGSSRCSRGHPMASPSAGPAWR